MGDMMAMYPKLSLGPNFDQIMKKKPYDPISHTIRPKQGIQNKESFYMIRPKQNGQS
jgi:hypothetical protein